MDSKFFSIGKQVLGIVIGFIGIVEGAYNLAKMSENNPDKEKVDENEENIKESE